MNKKTLILLFAASMALTSLEIACSKSEAQTPTTTSTGLTQLNKIVFFRQSNTFAEIWIANYDGSSPSKVNVNIASLADLSRDELNSVHLSPNGQVIFFEIANTIYSCNIDGSGLRTVITGNGNFLEMGGAY